MSVQDLYEFYSQNIARGAGRRKLVSLCAAGKVRDATSAAPAEKEEGEEEEEEGQAAPEPVAAAEDVTATLPAVPAVQVRTNLWCLCCPSKRVDVVHACVAW